MISKRVLKSVVESYDHYVGVTGITSPDITFIESVKSMNGDVFYLLCNQLSIVACVIESKGGVFYVVQQIPQDVKDFYIRIKEFNK